MAILGARLRKSSAFSHLLLAGLLGAISALGFEPLNWWPLSLAAIAGLFALLGRASGRRGAMALGWWFGFGQFALGLNWIATAFTYQAQMPAWLGWIGVLLLAAALAVFPALATLGGWLLARGSRAALVPALAGAWVIAEWLRGWVLTGFPWNPLGVIALGGFDRPGLAALLPWLGTYALSGLVVVLAGLAWLAAETRRWWLAPLALLPFFAPLHGDPARGHLAYTVVQPNTPQEELNDPATFESQFIKTAGLSLPRRPGTRRLVLWPESGVPDYLRSGYPGWLYAETTFASDPALARERIGRVIGPGSLLLTGAVDLDIQDGRPVGGRNVVTALDARGDIVASYAKAHLVPFGEYVPMRGILPLPRVVTSAGDFSPGPGPRSLALPGLPEVGPLICYESIFPAGVVDPAGTRPKCLLMLTNDGWFGMSAGPYQHLAAARARAVEQGIPVVRSANTGISAVIDSYGRVISRLGLGQKGILDTPLPRELPISTPYARFGDVGVLLLLVLAGLMATMLGKYD
jgi:apolipoprotein N-acyltransferase